MGIQRKRKLVGSFPPAEPEGFTAGVVAQESQGSGTPTSSWTKAQIIEYLDENEIEYQSSATKADLLELV